MRKIWSLIRTDWRREFSSPGILINYLVLPLIFTAAISAGLSAMRNTPTVPATTQVAAIKRDTGWLGDALLDLLPTHGLEAQTVEQIPDGQLGIVIPADFSEQLLMGRPVTLTVRAPVNQGMDGLAVQQSLEAAQAQLQTALHLAQIGAQEAQARGAFDTPQSEQAFIQQFTTELLQAARQSQPQTQVTWSSTKPISGAEQASAGQLVMWVQITLLGACGTLVNERVSGTLNRLLVAPTWRATILGGKLLARFLMGLLQMSALFISGALIFRVNWMEEPLPIIVISMALGLAILGLALFVATFVKTMGQAIGVVNGLAFGLAALGGAWWPLEITPPLYQTLVQVLPTTWAMQAYTKILVRSVTVIDVLPEVGVLLGFALVFFILGVWRFRKY